MRESGSSELQGFIICVKWYHVLSKHSVKKKIPKATIKNNAKKDNYKANGKILINS